MNETDADIQAPSLLKANGYGCRKFSLPDGRSVFIRPVRPSDRLLEQRFYQELSATTKYFRFHSTLEQLSSETLWAFSHNHYPKRMTLIANLEHNEEFEVLGFSRFFQTEKRDTVEFSITVADVWQGFGVGRQLLAMITKLAKDAGYHRIEGLVLAANQPMFLLAKKLGFSTRPDSQSYGTSYVFKELISS